MRKYLSKEFDPNDVDAVNNAYNELAARALPDVAALEKWILDWEELGAVISDRYSRAHVGMTVDTTDKAAEKQYMHIVENISPITETRGFELNKKLLACPHVDRLPATYACYLRSARTEVKLFRPENVPLKIEEHKLVNEYEKIMGALVAKFRGQEMTIQQLARYFEDPDRATRKEAFDERVNVRMKCGPALDDLYSRMLPLRQQIARNAGFKNFRDYQFEAYHRYDYTPADCLSFHDAIVENVVPLVSKMHDERMRKLGVRELKPWDIVVDPEAKAPILPFKDAGELTEKCREIFHRVDAELGGFFDDMMEKKLLDLGSRKGKAPGGYCTHFSEDKVPFIFMNAAGTKRDVDTLLHEGGHSFHYVLASALPLPSYHSCALEFAEVASMSMELLARPYFGEFYDDETLKRVRDDQLKKILEFFPFMAMIDAFQHWVYTAPEGENNTAGRRRKWAELEKRFQPKIDWSGYELMRDHGWQYNHVFAVPFYYIEYGIAQMGALAVWKQSLANHEDAVARYKSGLKLGGSRPLPELFSAVGAKFGLTSEVLKPLVSAVEQELS